MAVDAGSVIAEREGKRLSKERIANDTSDTIKELYSIVDKTGLLLTDESFALPTMGDMYVNSVSSDRLEKFKEKIEDKDSEVAPESAAFYVDKPYASDFGLFEDDKVMFIKAKPVMGEEARKSGKYDGDTLKFYVDTVVGDPEGKAKKHIVDRLDKAVSTLKESVKNGEYDYINEKLKAEGRKITSVTDLVKSANENHFEVRFLGYNAAEIEKWEQMYEVPVKDVEIKKTTYGKVKDDEGTYMVDAYDDRSDSDPVHLMKSSLFKELYDTKASNKWHEVDAIPVESTNSDGEKVYKNFWMLHQPGEKNKARRDGGHIAQKRVEEIISKSIDGYVYLMLNTSKVSQETARYGIFKDGVTAMSKGIDHWYYIWSQLNNYQAFTYQGFADWGKDVYGRYLGVPYVLTEEGYVNITKYVIAGDTESAGEIFPNYGDTAIDINNNQNLNDYFNMASYDYSRWQVYDIAKSASDYIDDRIKVQQDIFGKSFDELREWTVGIGDTFFIVPPTSINVTSEVEQERIRTMRSRGSAVKGGTKVDKYIEMDLYFNNEQGINGVPWETKLPNGKKITYFMNGLRALVAQFKFCPFLPIENRYINQMCNIEAVNLVSLQVSSVEGFPRTYVARVVLQAFDWLTYMPDLPANVDYDEHADEDEYFNIFAKSIDYQTMRWYYQRAIRTGNRVDGMDSISKEYIKETLGNNTALQPMHFESSDITFYVANEERLNQMMQAKIQALDTSKTYPILSQMEKDLAIELGKIGERVNAALGNKHVKSSINVFKETMESAVKAKKEDEENKNKITSYEYKLGALYESKTGTGNVVDAIAGFYTLDKDSKNVKEISGKVRDEIDNIARDLKDALDISDINLAVDKKMVYKLTKTSIKVGVRVVLDTSKIQNKTQIQNLTSIAASTAGGSNTTYNSSSYGLFDGHLDVFFDIPVKENKAAENGAFLAPLIGTGNYMHEMLFDQEIKIAGGADAPDIDLLNFSIAYKELADENGDTTNNEIADMMQTVDYISPYTLNYDKYNMGHVGIQDVAITYSNTFMKFGLNGTEGYASQYMGSEDAIIEITMHSMDEYAVSAINQMTSIQSRYARDYRLILPACPFRIDSEVTRMMGINEVLIEKVDVRTAPGNPGLYNITISAISMDRTLRSREALHKVNDWTNNGSVKNSAAQKLKLKTFDNMQETLAEAEVYPDLELPTIKELESKGFNFLRHLFDKERTYPDPDFYYVYGYDMQSDVFRRAVDNVTKHEENKTVWVDHNGDYATLEPDQEMAYKAYDESGGVISIDDLIDKSKIAANDTKEEKEYLKNTASLIKIIQSAENVEGWKVSDKIRVLGMDQYHQELLRQDDRIIEKNKKRKIKDEDGEERQGKWLNDKLANAKKASKLIKAQLDKPLDISNVLDRRNRGRGDFDAEFSEYTAKYIHSTFGEALGLLGFSEKELKPTDGILWNKQGAAMNEFISMIKSVGAAVSADKEETESSGKSSMTRFDYLGKCIDNEMNSSGTRRAADLADIRDHGIRFSVFGLRMLKRKEVKSLGLYGNIPVTKKANGDVNKQYIMLDPYYRRKGILKSEDGLKEIKDYKVACCKDFYIAAKAFVRIVMLFLAKAIDDKILPNVQFDLMNDDLKGLMNGLNNSLDEENLALKNEIDDYRDYLIEEDRPINMGKLFIVTMAAGASSSLPLEYVQKGKYDELSQMVDTAVYATGENISDDENTIFYRRFFKKLPTFDLIELESLGIDDGNELTFRKRDYQQRVFLDAVKDPNKYIPHSFHDMTVNDMRGRMAKAFPTFYMILVDEGRRIGMWKLHDNFYNINSISEIAVTKSRKNPADTCKITMSNMFHTYTTDDEDIKLNFEYDYRDVFNSIFNPTAIYEREETKRMNAQPMNKAKLVPGIRMHVRMGYNSNAANLPVVFNGTIAEVTAGETVEIIGQGDGIELLNPIAKPDSKNLDEGTVKKKIYSKFNSSQTPKEIFEGLLCNRGSFVERKIDEVTNGYYRSFNEYGIVHFGDPRYNIMFDAGEPIQNIYEAVTKPVWYEEDTQSADYGTEEPPQIAIKTTGRTSWDVMNIAASMSPDFVLGVAPFNMRSTIFHGHPRYYYAYDYVKDTKTNTYKEKRKPFQQYHIVTSYTDIIQNNLTASANNGMVTNAQGTFKTKGMFGGRKDSYTNRLYADWDIYPEYQKSMVYDTGIEYRGSEIIGKIPIVGRAETALSNFLETDGSGKEKAWRATAKALKIAMHDMYTGNIMLTGNPSIKPHDRIELFDTYENIVGPVLVESVTHIMSPDTGFTTDIVPDCIAIVDDRYEAVTQQTIKDFIMPGVIYGATTSLFAASLGKLSPSLSLANAYLNSRKSATKKVVSTVEGAVKSGEDIADEEDKKGRKKFIDKIKSFTGKTSDTDILKWGKDLLGAGTKFAKLGALANPIALAGLIVETLVFSTIATGINNKLVHTIRDKQVLEIYPVKKNSKVLTAGLTGNVGSVVGSTTAGVTGFYEKAAKMLATGEGGKIAKVGSWMFNLVSSDETKAYFERVSKRNVGDESPTTDGTEEARQRIISGVMTSLARSESIKVSAVKKLAMTPRITKITRGSEEELVAYKYKLNKRFEEMRVGSAEDLGNNPKVVREMEYIGNSAAIQQAVEDNYLHLIWKEQFNKEDAHKQIIFHMPDGEDIAVNTVVMEKKNKEGKKEKVYDIPFLTPDALVLLESVVKAASNYLTSDEKEKHEDRENFIVLTSATIAGEAEESMSATGLNFRIESVGKDGDVILEKIVEELDNIRQAMVNAGLPETYVGYERSDIESGTIDTSSSNKSVMFSVYPRA